MGLIALWGSGCGDAWGVKGGRVFYEGVLGGWGGIKLYIHLQSGMVLFKITCSPLKHFKVKLKRIVLGFLSFLLCIWWCLLRIPL